MSDPGVIYLQNADTLLDMARRHIKNPKTVRDVDQTIWAMAFAQMLNHQLLNHYKFLTQHCGLKSHEWAGKS